MKNFENYTLIQDLGNGQQWCKTYNEEAGYKLQGKVMVYKPITRQKVKNAFYEQEQSSLERGKHDND